MPQPISIKPVLLAVLAVSASPARADTICELMAFAHGITEAGDGPPGTAEPTTYHAETQAAVAMFEAVNAIDHRYQSYLGVAPISPNASQEAAAATAVHDVLFALFPAQRKQLDESYAVAMDAVPEGTAKSDGRSIGARAAVLALKAGLIDPTIVQVPYRPRTTPGIWVGTQMPATTPWSVAFKPWILPSVDAVRPPPPPALTSARYARDFNEVKALGAKTGSTRTAHQTLMARYRITPDMMPALRMAADQPKRRLVENARLFALEGMIGDDVGEAMSDAKLHYNFWRPVTAIRNAADDGNPATVADPSWEPLIPTPNHPEYPCGHCIFAAAEAALMTAEEGDSPAWGIHVASRSIPGAAIQALPSWSQWAREVSESRTLGGVHYRFSNEAGEAMGRKITAMALATVMRPLPAVATRD